MDDDYKNELREIFPNLWAGLMFLVADFFIGILIILFVGLAQKT